MREVDFLPAWYPRLHRRRRAVAIQAWLTLGVAAALGLWVLTAQTDVQARERELGSISGLLTRSQADVERLETLLDMQRKLGHQDQIFAHIGRPIETTRILTTLEELMPRAMSVLDISLESEEPKADTITGKAAEQKAPLRRLKVKLHGVAPSDADLANFLTKLTARPFFSRVSVSYSRPRTESQHVMREFEVSFTLDVSGMGGT